MRNINNKKKDEKQEPNGMKVVYLYSRPRTEMAKKFESGEGHDSNFQGMYGVRKYGIETTFFEAEQVLPGSLARWWREHVNIFWQHLPFFPLFLKYDIIFSGGAYSSLLLKAILHLKKPKWVFYDANVTGTIGDNKTLRQKLFKYAISKAEGIVALSQAEEDALREMFPHMGERAQFFYQGVNLDFYTPQYESNSNYIVSMGLDPSRDYGTLIEAMRGLPLELKIATRPSRVEQYQPLPENVTAKFYSHEELKEVFQNALFTVVPLNMKEDNNDSMGTYGVIEGMANGKAVIASKTKAFTSYIEDGKTGVFVPVRDVYAMRKAILDLYEHKEKREAIGKNARAFVEKHVDAEIFAEKLATFLKKIHEMD